MSETKGFDPQELEAARAARWNEMRQDMGKACAAMPDGPFDAVALHLSTDGYDEFEGACYAGLRETKMLNETPMPPGTLVLLRAIVRECPDPNVRMVEVGGVVGPVRVLAVRREHVALAPEPAPDPHPFCRTFDPTTPPPESR